MNFAPFNIGKYRFDLETTDTPQPRRDECQKLLGEAMARYRPEQTSKAAGINPKGDIPSWLFEVFDGHKMIGGLVLYAINIMREDDKTIYVSAFPMPGFSRLSPSDDVALRVECAWWFVSNDLPDLDGGKTIRMQEARFYHLTAAQDEYTPAVMAALQAKVKDKQIKVARQADARLAGRRLVKITAA